MNYEEVTAAGYPQPETAGSCPRSVDIVDNSNPKQFFADFQHISRTHSYQQVAVYAIFQKEIFNFIKSGKIVAGTPQR